MKFKKETKEIIEDLEDLETGSMIQFKTLNSKKIKKNLFSHFHYHNYYNKHYEVEIPDGARAAEPAYNEKSSINLK